MKKIVSIILTFALLITCALTSFAINFTDLPDDHWAKSYVDTLVNEGTINGYTDGTFKPTGTVTRAEFVKMLGKGNERSQVEYVDVPTSHWAYEYVMYSGFDTKGLNVFFPSQPITREEVVNLLYKRASSPETLMAPPIIHRQGENYKAVSWAYTNGIMTGNDNINLRLADTLTRAEAAALIIRARSVNNETPKTDFINAVSDEVIENSYNSLMLIDKPYDKDAKITNGELSYAAARIISASYNPTYPGVSATRSFEHKYSQSLNMVTRYAIDPKFDNIEYVEKNATVKDAIIMLTFATIRAGDQYVPYDENGGIYEGISGDIYENSKYFLQRAYQNGVGFTHDLKIDANKEITLKEFAVLSLMLDGISGFNKVDIIGAPVKSLCYRVNNDFEKRPYNASDYQMILEDIENKVYQTPFVNAKGTPKDAFITTQSFKNVFDQIFRIFYNNCAEKNVSIVIWSTPVLSCENQNGFTYRVKVEFVNTNGYNKLSSLIKCASDEIGNTDISDGMTLYLDIDTGSKFNNVTFPYENVFVNQVIK